MPVTAVNQIDRPALPEKLTKPAEATGKSSKDEFMKLFIAQLSNQSPLSPQDGADFIAQLATLSQVEQSAQMNQQLAAIAGGQVAGVQASYVGLIGRQVQVGTNTVTWPASEGTTLSADLKSGATKTTVTVKDEAGKIVRTIELGGRGIGTVKLVPGAWDGKDAGGTKVPPGKYTFSVECSGDKTKSFNPEVSLTGKVERMTMDQGKVSFFIGSNSFGPQDISSIKE